MSRKGPCFSKGLKQHRLSGFARYLLVSWAIPKSQSDYLSWIKRTFAIGIHERGAVGHCEFVVYRGRTNIILGHRVVWEPTIRGLQDPCPWVLPMYCTDQVRHTRKTHVWPSHLSCFAVTFCWVRSHRAAECNEQGLTSIILASRKWHVYFAGDVPNDTVRHW